MQKAPTAALHPTRLLFDGSTCSGTLSLMGFALPSSLRISYFILDCVLPLQKGGL